MRCDAGRAPIGLAPALVLVIALFAACGPPSDEPTDHGPVADGVSGPLGSVVPFATEEQRAAFERGRAVAERRFSLADGLGPALNVTFCASCHERPVVGGSAGLYRNFFLAGELTSEGAFFPTESAGAAGGVVRLYDYATTPPSRPAIPATTNVFAQRNPIPFFGAGLIAEIPEDEILRQADPDDDDGDGISGRANYDQGFVGRFGRKAQTVSIEGFIRGPLFNHIGVTTDPLSEEQRARLPVDSSGGDERVAASSLVAGGHGLLRTTPQAQAAAPAGPLTDDDAASDPELSTDALFDLVSFAMLLAAPEIEPEDGQTARGRAAFDDAGCDRCHTPRLRGPRGPLPIYSDLLLHDMGEALADGLVQGEATGSEFRTQPLWGITAVGPYLHDGRAQTIDVAIRMHAGEGQAAADAYAALDDQARVDLLAFLDSLGGADQFSPGLLPVGAPVPAPGEYGGPVRALSDEEAADFRTGRALFDREMGFDDGVGGPRFNGDSCRACHFEPVLGGAGPRGVNVVRHGIANADGDFVPPSVGTILHRLTALIGNPLRPQPEVTLFELRQTPHVFGLGLVESIADDAILANADPDDSDDDGISGRPSWTDGGRLGRFGWKAQVPTIAEFTRDAVTAELGMTIEFQEGLSFGRIHDNDAVPDPEMSAADAELLTAFLATLAPPPRGALDTPDLVDRGAVVFEDVGCADCHVPELPGAAGPVPLYSDLLLHETLPESATGIEDASADAREFRTAPLWGLAVTAPYMHAGDADTIDQAIRLHSGEADASRIDYEDLDDGSRDALLHFLGTL